MAIKKFAVAAYDDEEVLFPAVKKVRSSGYKIHDIYTPFAVHGLDEAMGLKGTDLHIAGSGNGWRQSDHAGIDDIQRAHREHAGR